VAHRGSLLVLDANPSALSGLELQKQFAGRTDMPPTFITGCSGVPASVQAMKAAESVPWKRTGDCAAFLRTIWACGFILFVCALDPVHGSDRAITQFVHTAWTEKEGTPTGILTLAQTTDGYLWLGTTSGLYRFDGVRFDRDEPRLEPALPPGPVSALLALGADLWVGFNYGTISLLKDGRATNYTVKDGVPGGKILGLTQDLFGTVWAATSLGLGRFDGHRWTKVGREWNFTGKSAHAVFVDRGGRLWVSTEDTLVVLPPQATAFEPTRIPVGYVAKIIEAANGRLWMAETSRSIRPVPAPGDRLPPNDTEIQVGSGDMLFDREGALWMTTLGDGLRRAVDPERLGRTIGQFSAAVESFTTKDRLTDDHNRAILQDREGNIWIGTNSGLDQFRIGNLSPVALPINPTQATLAAGDGGDVWVNSVTWMFHLQGTLISRIRSGVSGASAYRDPRGALWWTEPIAITRLDNNGRFTAVRLPEGSFVPGSISGAVRLADGGALNEPSQRFREHRATMVCQLMFRTMPP
jgi:ligand-binding sensor domain-containing protein